MSNLAEKSLGCTCFKLRRATRTMSRLYDHHMAAHGLKTTQYSLLSHVVKLGPIRSVDLADRLKMTASTLSRNLQPMVAGGWLEMAPGADARSRLVRATEAGVAKQHEAQRHWKAAQQKLNAQLGVERVVALHALIEDSLAILAPTADAQD